MIFPGTPGRFSDCNHALCSNVGKGPKGDGIIADVVRDDPYGVYRIQFKNSKTGEVYLTTPNMDPGSRIYFCMEELTYASDDVYTVPFNTFSPQQVGTIRDARVGDIVFYKLHDAETYVTNAIGIGIITSISLNNEVTFMQHNMLSIGDLSEIDAQIQSLQEQADTIQELLEGLPDYEQFIMMRAELNEKPFVFDTVANMQASNLLFDGAICHTMGFHSVGDDGDAWYAITSVGTPNGIDIIALQNELVAVLIVNDSHITLEMFGAWGDGTHDDSNIFEYVINFIANIRKEKPILYLKRKYLITRTITVDSIQEDVCFTIDGNSCYTFGDTGEIVFKTDDPNADIPFLQTNASWFKHIVCKNIYFARVRSSAERSNITALYGKCFGSAINEGFFENCGFAGWGVIFDGLAIVSLNSCNYYLNGKCFSGRINGVSNHGGNFYQNNTIIYNDKQISSLSFIGSWIEDLVHMIDSKQYQILSCSFIGCDIRAQSTQTLTNDTFINITSNSWQQYYINITDCLMYWNSNLGSVSSGNTIECFFNIVNSEIRYGGDNTEDPTFHFLGNSQWYDSSETKISPKINEGFDTKRCIARSPIFIDGTYSQTTPMRIGRRAANSNRVDYMDNNMQTMTWLPVYKVTSANNPTNPRLSAYFVLNDNPQSYGDFIFRYVNNSLEGKKIYDLVTYDPS